jgi:hypothetical protein
MTSFASSIECARQPLTGLFHSSLSAGFIRMMPLLVLRPYFHNGLTRFSDAATKSSFIFSRS